MLVQGSVVRMNNFVQRINPYPAVQIGGFIILIGQQANLIHWIGIYPLDNAMRQVYKISKDLCGQRDHREGRGWGGGDCSFFACIGEQTGLRYLPKD